jgi:hypothetical protein
MPFGGAFGHMAGGFLSQVLRRVIHCKRRDRATDKQTETEKPGDGSHCEFSTEDWGFDADMACAAGWDIKRCLCLYCNSRQPRLPLSSFIVPEITG